MKAISAKSNKQVETYPLSHNNYRIIKFEGMLFTERNIKWISLGKDSGDRK